MRTLHSFGKGSLTAVLIGQMLLAPFTGAAYDLSHSTLKKSPSSPFTVALVPFAEARTKSLDGLMDRIRGELKKTKGVRVMDEADTEEILRYYLNYVNTTADDTSFQKSLTEARQALLSGSYSQAENLLAAAERKIGSNVAAGGSNEGLYQVHLLRAKIHHANGSKEGVAREYDHLVHLHPSLELDANLYSTWERKALSEAKERLTEDSMASVRVVAKPQGSEVFLNGVHQGIAPLTIKKLPAGPHIIQVKTVHHAAFLQKLNLKAGEAATVTATLRRTGVAGGEGDLDRVTIRPSLYGTDLEISRLISTLGYHLGVDRIVLVSDKRSQGVDSFLYRVGDTGLGSVQKQHQFALSSSDPKAGVSGVVTAMQEEIRTDILKNPPKYADQSVGSVKLHEVRKKPFYKKPLFWILVGAAAGTGGALGAVLAPGAAAGGILIGF